MSTSPSQAKKPSVFSLLKNYRPMILGLVVLSLISNALSLVLPQFIQRGIDDFSHNQLNFETLVWPFLGIALLVFLLTAAQSVLQVLASEQVARDLRAQLADVISQQSYPTLQALTPAKLLTYLTSDVDAIKTFVSQAVVSLSSSLLLVIGASGLLLWTNWILALAVLCVLPLIAFTFGYVFSRVRSLFKVSQGVVDVLNRMINESILGAALVRVLNTGYLEMQKFDEPNEESRQVGLRILGLFAVLVPAITWISGLGTLIILTLGGYFVMQGRMTLGELTAFNVYMGLLIFPILVMGFTGNLIARASASYQRIYEVLKRSQPESTPPQGRVLKGGLRLQDVSVTLGGKPVLKDIHFTVQPGSRVAILGPTGAGKSLLIQVATGLLPMDQGQVFYDDIPIDTIAKGDLYPQMGLVFQESVLFSLSLRENIAFHEKVTEAQLQKAIQTAALADYIAQLPEGLDTLVSERGLSLSGGQKQRIMLARALAMEPRILFLDDFTARVDLATEHYILEQLRQNYPDMTLITVTQKVASVTDYDQIFFMAEGEILYQGSHQELMEKAPEYAQLAQSQRSTESYEVH
jgi:ATP-binding cassette, subfamily B, bacterial